MKPPISYYGGKQRMAPNIVPLLPRHTVYVEPFCGGAAIMFAKPWPKVTCKSDYREIINDKDGELINFYKQLRDNGPELCRLLSLSPYSEEEYRIAKVPEGSDIERARRYFINARQSFANQPGAGWGRAVSGVNHAATYCNAVARLPEYLDRMAGVYIACQDAITIIEQWDSPQTLFYCDPPYPDTCQGHYSGYSIDDYRALIEALNAATGNVVLSCYDIGIEMPGWERYEFAARMSVRGIRRGADGSKAERPDTERTEVVWRRWNTVPVRPEIQALYDSGAYDCFDFPSEEIARREPTLF